MTEPTPIPGPATKDNPITFIMFPERCLGCKAARIGIQEGRCYFACKTVVQHIKLTGRLHVKRSHECFVRQREGATA
jgi:hypothetical protein